MSLKEAMAIFFFIQTLAYTGVILTMIIGWGLWPENWLAVIVGYSLVSLSHPLVSYFAIKIRKAMEGRP